jgi:hypothetical protein
LFFNVKFRSPLLAKDKKIIKGVGDERGPVIQVKPKA